MKLLIADDERLCRKALMEVPWINLGISEVYEAQDGDEAIEMAKLIKPDIILSDIKMPNIDGFGVSEVLFKILPRVKIIFLTAHNDFDYAQKAIPLGVYEYILKPIDTKIIMEATQKAVNDINAEQERTKSYESALKQLDDSKYFLKNYFLSNVTNNINGPFKLDDNLDIFTSAVIEFYPADDADLNVTFWRKFEDVNALFKPLDCTCIPFFEQTTFTYILCFDKSSDISKILNLVLKSAEDVKDYLLCDSACNFTIGVGQIMQGRDNINFCNKCANKALKYNFHMGYNKIIYINDVEPVEKVAEYNKLFEKCLDCVKIGNSKLIAECISAVFNAFRDRNADIDTIQQLCLKYFSEISTLLTQYGQSSKVLFNNTDSWVLPKNLDTIDSIRTLMYDVTQTAICRINDMRNSKNNNLIETVKNIIDGNYGQDITRDRIAAQVHISPCYLSDIFSKGTNTTLKDYIIQTRINKAKELLKNTNLNIYEIANRVGYRNQKHFSFVFQKKTGLLPTKFRDENS